MNDEHQAPEDGLGRGLEVCPSVKSGGGLGTTVFYSVPPVLLSFGVFYISL